MATINPFSMNNSMGLMALLQDARRQALGPALLDAGAALLQAGAPSTNPQSAFAGLGQGAAAFGNRLQQAPNQALQQYALMSQVGKAQREEEQAEQQRQAQARLTARLTGAPNFARNPQLASAAGGPSGVSPQVNLAQLMSDPNAFADIVAASGGNPLPVIQALQKDNKPTIVPAGSTVLGRDNKPIFTAPNRPTELNTLFTMAGIDPQSPQAQQLARSILERKGQPMSVKVDNLGTIPPGYELFTTPEGARQMRPIPGSPAAQKVSDQNRAVEGQREQTARYGNIVLTDIKRVREKIENAPFYSPTTGLLGNVLKNVGGTAAADVRALTDSIRANIGFDRLQAMRDSSPTGGALGQVTERELGFLQATLGSLEQSQSEEQLLENLDRLEKIYTDIMRKAAAYPNAAQFGFDAAPTQSNDGGWQDMGGGVRIRRKQ